MKPIILILIHFVYLTSVNAADVSREIKTPSNFLESSKIEITVKKKVYQITGPSSESEVDVRSLSAQDMESFLKTRAEFLNQAAVGLQSLKWGFGTGVIIKNHFQYKADQRSRRALIDSAADFPTGVRDDILMAIQQQDAELQKKWSDIKNRSFSEKSESVITSILNTIDRQLWRQAVVVAHANEFGVLAAIGVEAEGGVRNQKGWGGLTDLGISIGYNRDDKSIAIQVFHDWEPYISTQMPVFFIGGIVTKAGLYVSHQGQDLTATGTSFYPPMTPGFSSSTNRSFMAGFSSGLTYPPSPIGDMLTYSNKLSQTTLVRVSLSHLTKGFVRIQSGALKQVSKLVTTSVKAFIKKFRSESLANKCENLF